MVVGTLKELAMTAGHVEMLAFAQKITFCVRMNVYGLIRLADSSPEGLTELLDLE